MKNKKLIAALLVSIAFISLIISFTMTTEEKWRSEVVYSGDADFVQLEIKDDKPHVAFSTDRGLVLASKNFPSRMMNSLSRHLGSSNWERKYITSKNMSGFYLSMSQYKGKIGMSHQYNGLTDRKLGYTHQVNGTWVTEEFDSVQGSGWGSGKYSSLSFSNGKPVIFYHTMEGDKFIRAERIDGNWDREVLETDTGMFISSDSCEGETHVIYSSREKKSLYKGLMKDGDWSSEKIGVMTDATTSVDMENCSFHAAYHNSEKRKIIYREGSNTEQVGDGKLSRLDLDYREKPRISYRHYGDGLYYAVREQGAWNKTLLDGERDYAGTYNDIETYSDGSPAIAYASESEVVFTRFGTGINEEIKKLFRFLFLITVLPAVLSLWLIRKDLWKDIQVI